MIDRALAIAVPLALSAPASQAAYWIAPNGNDSAAGTQAAPWRTLARGARAPAGATLHIEPGTYTEALVINQANQQWLCALGAKIIPPVNGADMMVQISAAGVRFMGCELDGRGASRIGVYATGTGDTVDANIVHDIATSGAPAAYACGSAGGAGISTDHWYGGTDIDVVWNEIYRIGPAAGCNTVQGIYPATSGTVANNKSHDNAGWGIVTYHDATAVKILSNETHNDGSGGIAFGCGGFYTITACDRFAVANNNIHDEPTGLAGSASDWKYIGHNSRAWGNTIVRAQYGCVDLDKVDTRGQDCPSNP